MIGSSRPSTNSGAGHNADLDNFIYTASHDLRAPITNVEGLMHALQAQLPAAVQQVHDVGPLLGMMEADVQHFLHTIEQVSDVVKQQQVHAGPVAEVALRTGMKNLRRDLRLLLAQAGAQVLLDVAPFTRLTVAAAVSFAQAAWLVLGRW